MSPERVEKPKKRIGLPAKEVQKRMLGGSAEMAYDSSEVVRAKIEKNRTIFRAMNLPSRGGPDEYDRFRVTRKGRRGLEKMQLKGIMRDGKLLCRRGRHRQEVWPEDVVEISRRNDNREEEVHWLKP